MDSPATWQIIKEGKGQSKNVDFAVRQREATLCKARCREQLGRSQEQGRQGTGETARRKRSGVCIVTKQDTGK